LYNLKNVYGGIVMNIKRLKYILVVLILVALILGGISIQTMASSDKLVFGMIVKWVGTPYITAFIQGAQQKADELGVELIIQDASRSFCTRHKRQK
jgi:ribose transport system substrate-binding protein